MLAQAIFISPDVAQVLSICAKGSGQATWCLQLLLSPEKESIPDQPGAGVAIAADRTNERCGGSQPNGSAFDDLIAIVGELRWSLRASETWPGARSQTRRRKGLPSRG